jgi:AAA+ ATPase superfamily predicted ATPase
MSQIADKTGIEVTSISKYLDELVTKYEVLERRLPVTSSGSEHKNGRYHIADPLLKFWFRYIYKNQSLVAMLAEDRLTDKITADLPTFMGLHFEVMTREILRLRNGGAVIPFNFDRIGGYWDRGGKVEIDIVAIDDSKTHIFFGECKLNGNQFHADDAIRLKEKARQVHWGADSRQEYFALISRDQVGARTRNVLQKEGIACIELVDLFKEFSPQNAGALPQAERCTADSDFIEDELDR